MTATLDRPSAPAPATAPGPAGFDPAPGPAAGAPREPLARTLRRRRKAITARALAPVARVCRPVLVAVRPLGRAAAVGAIVAFVLSRWFGWQELTVLAAALAGALVIAALSAAGRARYRVLLDLRSRRVVVGERATGRLAVTNTSRRRLLPAKIELPVGVAAASFPLPGLKAGQTHEESFIVPTLRRAVIQVGPARSVRGDAFGLIRRVVRWTKPEMLYIHPRTVALDGASPGFLKDLEGQATKELSNDDVSFHALRTYVPGDDRRYIHWKTSARTLATPARTLMVRQFEETRRSHLTVSLSTRTADYASPEEFELAVAVAASIGVQAFRDARQLSVVTSSAPVPAPTVTRMLDGFAGVALRPDADPVLQVARSTVSFAPDVSVAFLICGATPSPADIRAAALAFPLGVRVLAVRAVAGAAAALNRIGGVAVLTVGALEDLPRALRQAVRGR